MRRGRVRSACVRCRRQKLKCDSSLPCQLCIRSGAQCVSSTDLFPNPSNKPTSNPCSYTLEHCSPTPITGKRKADILPQRNMKIQRTQPHPVDSATHNEDVAVFRLVEQIFATTKQGILVDSSSHPALPRRHDRYVRDTSRTSIRDILGDELPELPPQEVSDILVASYIQAIHWYFPLLHEPSFRTRLNSLLHKDTCSLSDRPFLLLSVAVMLLGLQFAAPEDLEKIARILSTDTSRLQARFISFLEKNFLESFEQYNLDWICFSLVLAMHNVLNRRPRRTTIIIGSAIQAAKDMRLDKEPANNSGLMTTLEIEMRKRVWWTIFAADGFVATVACRAPTIRPEEISITEPVSLDDNSTQSTEFQSMELREDGSLQPVTTYSYHRYRAKLYLAASRLNTKRSISQRSFKNDNYEDEMRDIYDELDRWRKMLPPELCLDSYTELKPVDERKNPPGRVFRLQALTLRLLYEHMQVLLFWPFIRNGSEADSSLTHSTAMAADAATTATSAGGNSDMASLARARCFQSAMRIACIDQHHDILRMASKTPVVIQLGALSITSGAILGKLALLNPTSTHVREYKIGLASIIKLPQMCGFTNTLWEQATEILKDVLRVICSEEAETLLAGDFPPPPAQFPDEDTPGSISSTQGIWVEGVEPEEVVDDGIFSGAEVSGFVDMDILADCYTTLVNLYGPNLDLGNLR